jgi:hypothetical protein
MIRLLNLSNTLTDLPFGSALIFELRQDSNGLFYIQIQLRNNTQNEPISLKLLKMEGHTLVNDFNEKYLFKFINIFI